MEQSILYRFFEGKTSLEEEIRIRQWMEASPQNQETLFKERRIYDAILLSATDEELLLVEKQKPVHRIIWILSRVAAILFLIISIGYVFNRQYSQQEALSYFSFYVPPGQKINMTLPDGTEVWLNSCTRIKYPQSFNRRKRHVILDGEAYFQVSHDKRKPFVVQTEKYSVEVLGTEFNVNSYAADKYFATTLFSGAVKIISNENQQENIELKPQDKAYLANGRLIIVQEDNPDCLAWKDNLIVFKQTSFAEIMKSFERYFDVKISINNEELKQHSFTGKFRQTDGLDYALKVLQKYIDFNYTKEKDSETIRIQ